MITLPVLSIGQLTVTPTYTAVTCNGLNNGIANAAASGGVTPYTYSWSDGGGTDSTATGLSAITYTITVTDFASATAMASVNITQPTPLTPPTITSTNVTCIGGNNGSALATEGSPTPGSQTFSYEPAIQHFTVPVGVTQVTITLAGARGGSGGTNDSTYSSGAGLGASFTGVCMVTTGHVLSVVVGGQGGYSSNKDAGGGGASWVYDSTAQPGHSIYPTPTNEYLLAVAAGGGGEGYRTTNNAGAAGGTNLTTNATTTGAGYNGDPGSSPGGTGGNGGTGGEAYGGAANKGGCGGGAGWFSNGGQYSSSPTGIGGDDWANSFASVSGEYNESGGFGGGGGGYNGGGGGFENVGSGGGGGGGSYFNTAYGTLPGSITATNTGNGSVTISYPAAARGNYTYTWLPGGQTTYSITGLSAGTYTVTMQNGCGASASASVTINQPNPFSITATSNPGACAGIGNGNAVVSISGGTSPYTYSWSNGNTTASTGDVLSAGTYSVTVQDSCGNSASSSVSIQQSPLMTATASVKTAIVCNGASTGAAEVRVTGGISPYTYSWSADGGANATINSYFYINTKTFSYEPTVQHFSIPLGVSQVSINVTGAQGGGTSTGGYGASFTGVCTVTPGHILSVVVGQQGTTSSSYKAGGGGGASWVYDSSTVLSSPSGTNGLLAIAAGGGGEGFNSYGGAAGGTNLSANATTSGINTAAGGAGGSGGAGGTSGWGGGGGAGWLSNGANGSGMNFSYGGDDEVNHFAGGAAGTDGGVGGYGGGGGGGLSGGGGGGYNGGGAGLDYTISSGGGGGSYLSSYPSGLVSGPTAINTGNGSVTISYVLSSSSGLAAGTYSVTVTDNNGCTATASVTLTQPNLLSVTANMLVSASSGESNGNASANPLGGTTPYTYTWSNGVSTVSVSNPTGSILSAGTYTVTVQDNCGASAMASVTIYNTLTASITTASDVSCYDGNNGSVSASPSGGKSPYTYSWGGGEGSNSTISELHAGVYSVTVWDNLGASATASVKITQPATVLTAAAVTTANVSCNGGSNGVAKVSVSGGKAPYAYFWSPNTSSTYIASGLSAGTYTVTVVDNNGCNASSSTTLTQPTLLKDSVSTVTYPQCGGETAGATIGVTGGTSPYRYTWSPNVSTTASATGLTIRGYVVQVKDVNGCYNDLSFSITQPPIPVLRDSIVRAATVNVSCNGSSNGSATVGVKYGTTPYTYSWSVGGGTNATINGLSVGTYSVTVNDAGGCTATASVSIGQSSSPLSSVTAFVAANVSCNGGSNGVAKVSVSGGSSPYTYSWLSPASGSTYIASGLSVGTYTVTVTDNCGTSASSSAEITQPAILSDSVITSSIVSPPCSGGGTGSAAIGVTGGTSPYRYTWSPNVSTAATATGLTVRSYIVQVKDKNGCYNNITISVTCSSAPATATYKGDGASCCPSSDNINLYPNPNTGQFTLSGLQQGMILEMYDYTGKMISTMTTSNKSMRLNILNQADGIYLIRILDKDGNLVSEKKVVKTQ